MGKGVTGHVLLSLKQLRKSCDNLWARLVKLQGDGHCIVCGETKYLNAHHMISRENYSLRYDLNNSAILCVRCHRFGYQAVHVSPWFFEETLRERYPDKYTWFISHRKDPLRHTLSEEEFIQTLRNLIEIYAHSASKPKLLSWWYTKLISKNDLENIYLQWEQGNSAVSIAKKYNVNVSLIYSLLRKSKRTGSAGVHNSRYIHGKYSKNHEHIQKEEEERGT